MQERPYLTLQRFFFQLQSEIATTKSNSTSARVMAISQSEATLKTMSWSSALLRTESQR